MNKQSLKRVSISEIKSGMRGLIIEGIVVEKGEAKLVKTRYGPALVSYAIIYDETGAIRLNLWRGQIQKVKVGAKIRVVNAFVKKFRGRLELNVGGDGRIEVVEE